MSSFKLHRELDERQDELSKYEFKQCPMVDSVNKFAYYDVQYYENGLEILELLTDQDY